MEVQMSSIAQCVAKDKDDKTVIKSKDAFCYFFGNSSHDNYRAYINNIKVGIKGSYPEIADNAFNKCNGDWYEWLISIASFSVKNESDYLLINLPTSSQLDVTDLYVKEVSAYISDFKKKLDELSGITLVTSNPDFIIIRKSFFLECYPEFEEIDHSHISVEYLESVDSFYNKIFKKCKFEDIVGYLSVKTSFRPDRRLQISHEGSLMKALYAHIETREWLMNAPGIKYYAAAPDHNDQDEKSLRTVATHSIANLTSKPLAAVDGLFKINSEDQVFSFLSKIT